MGVQSTKLDKLYAERLITTVELPKKAQALIRLKALMSVQNEDTVFVFQLPKPGKLWYDIGGLEPFHENPGLMKKLRNWLYLPREHWERRHINLSTLHSNQPVFTDYLKDFISSGEALDYRSGDRGGEITVVRWRGENIIADGHHRLSAMKLLGKREADVEFLDLDKFIREYK